MQLLCDHIPPQDWNKLTKALNTEDLALSKASVQVQKQLDRLKVWMHGTFEFFWRTVGSIGVLMLHIAHIYNYMPVKTYCTRSAHHTSPQEEEKWLRKLLEHDAARLLDDDTVLTDKQPPPARDEHGGGDGGGAASASRARVGQEGAAEHPRPAPS